MPSHQTLLCRYHYDPLDRLAGHASAGEVDTRLFYQKSRLATQIQGALRRSVLQFDDQLLAQQQFSGKAVETALLATDQQRSILQSIGGQCEASAYTPYGHLPMSSGLSCLLGFDGERRDPVTGHYLLGNGYRAFNPVLMRFNSPDSLSPFGEGGLNAYAYCQGDPVNYRDPTGHIKLNLLNRTLRPVPVSPPPIRRVPTPRRPPTVSTSQPPVIQPARSAVSHYSGRPDSGIVSSGTALTSSSAGVTQPALRSTPAAPVNVAGRSNDMHSGTAVGWRGHDNLVYYDDAYLRNMGVGDYEQHIKDTMRAWANYKQRSYSSDDKFFPIKNVDYLRYMLAAYEGRFGEGMAPNTRSAMKIKYKKQLAENSAIVRSGR